MNAYFLSIASRYGGIVREVDRDSAYPRRLPPDGDRRLYLRGGSIGMKPSTPGTGTPTAMVVIDTLDGS